MNPHPDWDGSHDHAQDQRKLTAVAVGILLQADGQFLLCSRPVGKVYSGYWEFPGGKLEAGEDTLQALARELQEELGIEVTAATVWRETIHSYPHARVALRFCLVSQWRGTPTPRESQQLAWQSYPPSVTPLLPGTLPVLDWFAQTPPQQLFAQCCAACHEPAQPEPPHPHNPLPKR